MLEHFIPPMNALKCLICKGGVFVDSEGLSVLRGWFRGAFLMLPPDSTTQTHGFTSGWKAFIIISNSLPASWGLWASFQWLPGQV